MIHNTSLQTIDSFLRIQCYTGHGVDNQDDQVCTKAADEDNLWECSRAATYVQDGSIVCTAELLGSYHELCVNRADCKPTVYSSPLAGK